MKIRLLGITDYMSTWQAMKQFTITRDVDTPDELWLLEHYPVFTQGQAGKKEHILHATDIPIVQSDRGGQVTYHGPGQLVGYLLMDLRRRNLGVRTLVCELEKIIIQLLKRWHISAHSHCGAPGVYVNNKKIASVGLRVKNSCTYHGFALNVDMDLTPFQTINPCGYSQLQMTQMSDYPFEKLTMNEVSDNLATLFMHQFNHGQRI
jgi:lipoyl(octanoyl) transferase